MGKNYLSKNYRKQAVQHKKWLAMWSEFEQQIQELPEWKQKILLDDLHTSFRGRMSVMRKTGQYEPEVCTAESAAALQQCLSK